MPSITAVSHVLPGQELPGACLTNAALSGLMQELSTRLDREFPVSSPEFPRDMIGIEQRCILDQSLTTRDLAVAAGRAALAQVPEARERIRVVIVGTVTCDQVVPALATTVAAELGLSEHLLAFDFTLGCNGFVAALDVASRVLQSHPPGSAALVVGADAMIRVLDASDRATCCIFGDGGGAVVLENDGRPGITSVETMTRGEKGPLIEIREDGTHQTVYRFTARDGQLAVTADLGSQARVMMQGRAVFRDMVSCLPEQILNHLAGAGLRPSEVDLFLFHQANRRILEAVAADKRLGLAAERWPCNIGEVGNTTNASIPILMSQLAASGQLESGQKIMLVGFGTGYSMGMATLTWSLPRRVAARQTASLATG